MSAAPSPDVLFAQKATALVKAARLDPRSISLESFRQWAPVIFCRAYNAIYKEELIITLNEHSSREDQILNVQLVIDGLTSKTRNPALTVISGMDVVQGNYRAIGVLVGVLFSEGQRLWLEKFKNQQHQEQQLHYKERERLRSPSDIEHLSSGIQFSPHKKEEQNNFTRNQQRQHNEKEIGNAEEESPAELEKLVNRINFLEHRLHRRAAKKAHRSELRRSRSRSAKRREESPVSDKDLVQDVESHMQKLIEKQRKQRPSSAPSTRKVKAVSSRLYYPAPVEQEHKITTSHRPSSVTKPCDENHSTHSHRPRPPMGEDYTYDLQSGRRIPLAIAQRLREERQRQAEVVGKFGAEKNIQNLHEEKEKDHKVEYPGKRTEKSVTDWLEKMRRQLPVSVNGNANTSNSAPRPLLLELYEQVEEGDLVLSVEHCHQCQHHSVSLRHDPEEYSRLADDFLKNLALAIFQSGLCVRLGVARVPAKVTPKSKSSDVDSRIGAFEIQAAFRSNVIGGDVIVDILHSKLQSRRWPAKSVVEKRLMAFLSKTKMPTCDRSAIGRFHEKQVETNELSCPTGHCQWEDVALAQPGWSFPTTHSVQWVFDARSLAHLPRFPVDSIVWAQKVSFAANCVEKYALLGTVVRYSSNKFENRRIFVNLKYANEEVEVLEKDCLSLRDGGENGTNSSLTFTTFSASDKLPADLEGLLLLARRENCISWRVVHRDDAIDNSTGEILLSRASFFNQSRALVWKVVQMLKAKGVLTALHPLSQKPLDLFNVYSERALEFIVAHCGTPDGRVSIARMNALVPQQVPRSIAAKESTSTITQETHACVSTSSPDMVSAATRPVSAKPTLSRPILQSKKPSVDEIDAVYPLIEGKIRHPDCVDAESALNTLKVQLSNRAQILDDGLRCVFLADFVLLLHEFGLGDIADDGATMKKMTYFFSFSAGRGDQLKADELLAWFEKHIARYSRIKNDLVPSTAANCCAPLSTVESVSPSAVIVNSNDTKMDVLQPTVDVFAPVSTSQNKRSENNEQIEEPALTLHEQRIDNDFASLQSIQTPTEGQDEAKSLQDQCLESPVAIVQQILPPTVMSKPAFHNKDLVLSSIVLDGPVLIHSQYDSVFVNIEINNCNLDAKVCLTRERGSKRRSFNVNWGEIAVSARNFQENYCIVSVFVADAMALTNHPSLPSIANTTKGQSPNSIQIPLSEFFESSFEIKCSINLPIFGEKESGIVSIVIHGHAHEAKEARKNRIMSMKPVELLNLRFEPLPVDDDYFSGDSDEEGDISPLRANSGDVNDLIFPVPSFSNLLSTSIPE